MRDVVDLNELFPLILEVIENGGEFHLYPRGTSMEPLLHAGDDSVMLGAVGEIKNGDVLFYRRKNGQFVLHRLIKKRGDTLIMCGDSQRALEYDVLSNQVFAKMVGFYKGDIYHTVDEPEYLEYVKKQLSRFPFYRTNPTIYKFLRKVKHMIKRS
ncbi:MAG: S24/S26 family peptidase [Clostridia bacterium]|nr:S24/S26 family peptidase [Clostridia bacterium]